ncbi:hypothetical protein POTOM_044352 [Populus tomentosa]|uniref:Uncharacterized protein n=1 Tax=Populus tomentosa TaxID=118781 RepID=A0A8X7YPB5_POPTO|nr:hypothetical protein POTOM_044352 [Populus tomentosa]
MDTHRVSNHSLSCGIFPDADCGNGGIIIVYCVLEFLLPRFRMKDTSERELLINKVLRTLQRKCVKSWKVSAREVNDARCLEVRLDNERTPNIPQETVSRVFQLPSSNDCGNGGIIIVDCVLEFLLPRFRMKNTSERELLINKVLRTLQRKCLKMWKVSVREVNEPRGSEDRLDDERTPNIPQETVSRVFQLPSSDGVLEGNGSTTLNPTGNQAEDTREPLGQKRPSVLDGHPSFRMKDTSEREILINKVLHILQRKSLKLRNVSVREVNEARGSDVRLDDERTPNIPQETVSRVFQLPSSDGVLDGNGSLTLNPTGNQAEEKREPLGQKRTSVSDGHPSCVQSMKETSERELLINKVLRTLQRKCLKLWKDSVREVNEARGSEVRLDYERTPNIPQETVSRVFQLPSSDADYGNGGLIIVDCVLEFLLPRFSMKETSERELLINKVLRTLQRKCLKLWKVSVREVNEARGSEVRLDYERTPNIPQETVSRVFQLPSSDDSEWELLINKVLRTLQRKCLKIWRVSVREVNEARGSEDRLDDERTPNIPQETVSRVFQLL